LGFSFTFVLLLSLLVVMLLPQLPATTADWLRSARHTYRMLWPQGWTFFADAASKPALVSYRLDGPESAPAPATKPLMSRSNWWGIGRIGDGRQAEARQLAQEIPTHMWRACGATSVTECANLLARYEPYTETNRSRMPVLCGRMLFTLELPAKADAVSAPGTAQSRRVITTAALASVVCTR
jgi:hypothetical protein